MQFFSSLLLVAAVAAPAVLADDECKADLYTKLAPLSKYSAAQDYCEKTYPSVSAQYLEKRGDKQYPVCRTLKEASDNKDLYNILIKLPAEKNKIACECIKAPEAGPGETSSTTAHYSSTTSADYSSTTSSDYTSATSDYSSTTSSDYSSTTSSGYSSTTLASTTTSAATTTTAKAAAQATDCFAQGSGAVYIADNGKKLANACDSFYGTDIANTISSDPADSFKACQERCATTSGCIALNYVYPAESGSPDYLCYLLNSIDYGYVPEYSGIDSATIST